MAERITQGIGGSRSTVRFDHMGEANYLLTDVPMSMGSVRQHISFPSVLG
jgi:hypothetical protein